MFSPVTEQGKVFFFSNKAEREGKIFNGLIALGKVLNFLI